MATLLVRVQPRAKRNEIVGWHGDRLRVRLTAPPVDGAANEALIRLIAAALGVKPSHVQIVHGLRSREKTLAVEGLDQTEIAQRLA